MPMWGENMRTLARNRQTFYYANCTGSEKLKNPDGRYTGEKKVVYTDPIRAKGNISADKGNALVTQFGTDIQYDAVIVMSDTQMDENSVLWVGISTDKPYNYKVTRISRSLNSVSIAISRVNVK